MSHEPECESFQRACFTDACICHEMRTAYRRGFNDHARSRAYAEQVYGPYTQHGKGENP